MYVNYVAPDLNIIDRICVCHMRFVANPKNLPAIFLYHMKGKSF